MALIIFRVTRSIICVIVVCLWATYHDSVMYHILEFYWRSARMGWRPIQSFLTCFICRTWSGSAAIFWMSWITHIWGWSLVWCDMGIMVSTGVMALQSAPMVVSTVSMMWPGIASVGVMMTVTMISPGKGLLSWSAVSTPVLVTVSRSRPFLMPGVGILSMMMGRCAWGWYPVWTVHYYTTIFITFKATYILAVMCYVA